MNKITKIRVQDQNGHLSEQQYPVGALAQNIVWKESNESISIVEIAGDVHYEDKGSLQKQIDDLSETKAEKSDVTTLKNRVDNINTTIDPSLNKTSGNPVANQAIATAIETLTTKDSNLQDSIDNLKTQITGLKIDIDDSLSSTSSNPVQNRVINNALVDLGNQISQSGSFSLGDRLAQGSGTRAVIEGTVSGTNANVASGTNAWAAGQGTIATGSNQTVFGKYNISNSNMAEIVGGGTSNSARANIRTLDWQGNETITGKLTVGAAPTNNNDVVTKQYMENNTVTQSRVREIISDSGGQGGTIPIDAELDDDSANPVQNRVITNNINTISSNVTNLNGQVNNLNTRTTNLNNKTTQLETSINNISEIVGDDNTGLVNQVNSLNTTVDSLTNEDLPARVQTLEDQKSQIDNEILKIHNDIQLPFENLIEYPYVNGAPFTNNDIKYTVNSKDASISCSKDASTSSSSSLYQVNGIYMGLAEKGIYLESGHVYKLSGCPSGGSSSTYSLWGYLKGSNSSESLIITDNGNGYIFTPTFNGWLSITIAIAPSVSQEIVNTLIFKPMVQEYYGIKHSYIPPKGWIGDLYRDNLGNYQFYYNYVNLPTGQQGTGTLTGTWINCYVSGKPILHVYENEINEGLYLVNYSMTITGTNTGLATCRLCYWVQSSPAEEIAEAEYRTRQTTMVANGSESVFNVTFIWNASNAKYKNFAVIPQVKSTVPFTVTHAFVGMTRIGNSWTPMGR